jgi:MOSC domain-containing protein YiiM
MGEIVSIWIKRAHGGPMDAVSEAEFVVGRGVRGSADQGGKRQITIIDEGAWSEAEQDLGVLVDPRSRRANVMLRGLDLENSRGKLLRLGHCAIRVYGEVRPCQLMDEMHPGLRDALKPRWRGGVFAEIVEGGRIKVGDGATWVL